jgi:hypothetical protein
MAPLDVDRVDWQLGNPADDAQAALDDAFELAFASIS